MSQYGHFTITCGCYIKRRNMSGKGLFVPLKVFNFHLNCDFLTPGGPLYDPTKYHNFAQSPFNLPLTLVHIGKIQIEELFVLLNIMIFKNMCLKV